jgi:hypothetical protein
MSDKLSAEEILEKHVCSRHDPKAKDILMAMEEYASQLTPSLPLTDEEIEKKARAYFMTISFPNHQAKEDNFKAGYKSVLSNLPLDRWISVEERLPEHDNEVIVFERDSFIGDRVTTAFYHADENKWRFFADSYACHPITHWQPLPAPPTIGEIINQNKK